VIALPDEENVWDDPDSEEGDEDNAEGASPVSPDCAEFTVRAIADTTVHVLPSPREEQE
jgi:hypothetical protein